jgi:hypothetical protein
MVFSEVLQISRKFRRQTLNNWFSINSTLTLLAMQDLVPFGIALQHASKNIFPVHL